MGATIVAGAIGVAAAGLSEAAPPTPDAGVLVGKAPTTFISTTSVTTAFATVPVPAGYTVYSNSGNTLVLTADSGRSQITVSELAEPTGIDIGVLTSDLIDSDRSTLDSNGQICADDGTDSATFTLADLAATGTFLPMCLSVVPQNAPAFTARNYSYAALATQNGQPVALVVQVFGSTSRFPQEVSALGGFVPAIHWDAT